MGFMFNQGDRPLEGYTIQRGVGRGGFGEVYHALSDGGKEVALKYLRENPQVELRGVQHCLNLKSPHLVTIYDVKQNTDGEWFVIMEYVAGPSLRDLMIEAPRGLGVQKAAYFLREMSKGLTYLHDRGIVHRDMKPGNLFYEDGYVKIGDYGLSKVMSPSQHSGQTMSVGTVHYMAPEVGSGNYSKTIDIYAVGVMLYEMLLGRVPYQGATMGEVLMKHLTAQPEVDELPAPFPRVIRKALAKDPNDRYQNVSEMVNDVFAGADMQASVSAFEPASLSAVAARVAAQSIESPSPRPAVFRGGERTPGGVAVGTGSSNIGHHAAETMAAPQGPPLRGPALAAATIKAAAADMKARHLEPVMKKRLEKLGLALLLMLGVATAAEMISSEGRNGSLVRSPIAFGCVAAMVAGTMLGTYISFHRMSSTGYWPHRFINAACVAGVLGLFTAVSMPFVMILGPRAPAPPPRGGTEVHVSAGGSEEDGGDDVDVTATIDDSGPEVRIENKADARTSRLKGETKRSVTALRQRITESRQRLKNAVTASKRSSSNYPFQWAGPLLLLVLLGDWSGRVYRGRQGQVDFGRAFSAAIFALIVGGALMHVSGSTVAVIAAAASVTVQLVSSLWPMRDGELIPATCKHGVAMIYRSGDGPVRVGAAAAWPRRTAKREENVDSDHVGVERGGVRPAPPVMAAGRMRGFGSGDPVVGPAMRDDRRPGIAPLGVEPLEPLRPEVERSRWVRTLWLMLGMVVMAGSILGYVAYGTEMFEDKEDALAACAAATAGMLFSLFGVSRSLGRQRHGFWRGIVRPLVFTAGLASVAAAGVVMGNLDQIYKNGTNMREASLACLVFIIGGVLLSLFVWLVPVAPYVTRSPAGPTPDQERDRQMRTGMKFVIAGWSAFASLLVAIPILENVLGRAEKGAVIPPVSVTLLVMTFAFLVRGYSIRRGARGGKPVKLRLPLQRTIPAPRGCDLEDMIPRHFHVLGYQLATRGRLLWTFERGSYMQLTDSWRQFKTTVNIAAYEVPEGYRITCVTDVSSMWHTIGQKGLTALMSELEGLEQLVAGGVNPMARV